MFKLFTKNMDLFAPVSGECHDIVQCADTAFSSKAMGDGFLIIPDENIIKSPCNGKITALFPTKHAVGITMADGKEILVHIGIDTVKLNGKHFHAYVSKGDKVKVGTPIIRFDQDYMLQHDVDMSTMVILINRTDYVYKKYHMNERISSGEKIIKFESGD